jgi:hypothetical protein
MTNEARKLSGIIMLTVPTIIYGGYFLLAILSGNMDHLGLTDFQKAMFRAGHAHAGVLVILSLIVQVLADHANLSRAWKWISRLLFPVSAILVSSGFFASAAGKNITEPTSMIFILYSGMVTLVTGLLVLGIGLLRNKT